MSRADYAHWNEEADLVWWAEEGRHVEEPQDDWPENLDAEDAFWEEMSEADDDALLAEYECGDHSERIRAGLRDLIRDRGLGNEL